MGQDNNKWRKQMQLRYQSYHGLWRTKLILLTERTEITNETIIKPDQQS